MAAEAASDMKVRVKQRCPWIPLCRKKWHLLTFTNACWALMETKQWTWAHSEAVGDVFQQWWQQHERQAMFQMATHSCHTTEWRASQSPNPGELVDFRVLCTELNTILNVLETMVAILEYRKVCSRWVSWLLTLEQKEHCMQLCQDLLNQHKAEGDGFLDHVITSNKLWCYPKSWCQNGSSGSVNVNSPLKKKCTVQPSAFKVMCTVFLR